MRIFVLLSNNGEDEAAAISLHVVVLMKTQTSQEFKKCATHLLHMQLEKLPHFPLARSSGAICSFCVWSVL